MILGKVQATIGMKKCRIKNICYECGVQGFPSCDAHRELLETRRDKLRVDATREESTGECSICGFDFRATERFMKKASSIMILKLFYGNLPEFLGTGLPLDIPRITKIGKRVVLKKQGLEEYAHLDIISTITPDNEMVCIKCL